MKNILYNFILQGSRSDKQINYKDEDLTNKYRLIYGV